MDGTGKNVKMKRKTHNSERGKESELRRERPQPFIKDERQPPAVKLKEA
jgi:hypothetical protein